eukprot:scaffold18543_cov140-Isochrysis_galbana.AAC.2
MGSPLELVPALRCSTVLSRGMRTERMISGAISTPSGARTRLSTCLSWTRRAKTTGGCAQVRSDSLTLNSPPR